MADGGHADTINSHHAETASHTDLRDYAVRLMNWRERHCLCRRGDDQGEDSQRHRPDHFLFLPFFIALSKGITEQFSNQQEDHSLRWPRQ
jgi:hypothetical protein